MSTAMPKSPKQTRVLVFLSIIVALLTARLAYFVYQDATSIPFNDQWDFYPPAWTGAGFWDLFRQRHGPHRMGIAHVFSVILGNFTGWDIKVETYATVACFMISSVLALFLKYKISGKLNYLDALLVLLIMNFAQGEIFVAHSNFYMGPVPQLLILVFSLCWFVNSPWLRWGILSFLNFIILHTGYGMFLGFLTPILALMSFIYFHKISVDRRSKLAALMGLGLSILSLVVFYSGYHFDAALACYKFPHPRPWEYLSFLSFMFGRFAFEGSKGIPFLLGLLLLGSVLYAAIQVFLNWFRQLKQSSGLKLGSGVIFALFSLMGFTLLYMMGAAVGRVCLGPASGSSSRYIPYLVPALVGAYIYFSAFCKIKNFRKGFFIIFGVTLIVGEFYWRQRDYKTFDMYSKGKKAWIACYLEKKNVDECDQAVEFKIYPIPHVTSLQEKMNLLEERGWSIFHDSAETEKK